MPLLSFRTMPYIQYTYIYIILCLYVCKYVLCYTSMFPLTCYIYYMQDMFLLSLITMLGLYMYIYASFTQTMLYIFYLYAFVLLYKSLRSMLYIWYAMYMLLLCRGPDLALIYLYYLEIMKFVNLKTMKI